MKGILLNNFYLKAISFFVAFIFWVLIVQSQKAERTLLIRLNIVTPQKYKVTNEYEKQISVKVRGQVGRIKRINASQIYGRINIRDGQTGYISYPVTSEKIDLPFDVEILSIKPSIVFLNVEKLTVKQVPVKMKLSGPPPLGYSLVNTIVNPTEVEIEGPESELSRINEVSLPVIDVRERFENFSDILMLENPSPNITILNKNSYRVDVKFKVNYLNKKFYNIPIETIKIDKIDKYTIFPETIAFVVIEGPEELVSTLKKNDINIKKDLYSTDGDMVSKLEIKKTDFILPRGVVVIDYKPKEVMVKVGE